MAVTGVLRQRSAEAEPFYAWSATIMALVVVAGFSLHLAMGRSTFAARPLVHVHGLVFMGWVLLFTAQAWLAVQGPHSAHRLLGRITAVWVVLMMALGFWITVDVVQRGITPFFFQPQHFLIANPFNLLMFGCLIVAALRLRHQPDWHMRLQLCAMTSLLNPGLGRLLPTPLLVPHAWEIPLLVALIFPVAGIVRDWRHGIRFHPAYLWGMVAIALPIPVVNLIAPTALGDAIYAWTVAGHPGEVIAGMAFPPPPPM